MKTKEELNALKEEVEALNSKLAELSEEELAQVAGGLIPPLPRYDASAAEQEFRGSYDGSSKPVKLNIGPQEYDCSGVVD